MRVPAKPAVNLFVRVDTDTDARRRRLQEVTGYSGPRLVGEALREYERVLDSRRVTTRRGRPVEDLELAK
jgi:hypothetical protein